jgi:hypothetical protein
LVEFTDAPLMLRLHDAFVKIESVSVKVKFNDVAEVLRPLMGEVRITVGPTVMTVKLLGELVPVLLAASVQETVQL